MYKQVLDPVGNSLGLSTIFAALPLVTLFVLLGRPQAQGSCRRPVVAAGGDPRRDHRLLDAGRARRSTPAPRARPSASSRSCGSSSTRSGSTPCSSAAGTSRSSSARSGASATTSACRRCSSPSASAPCSRRWPASARRSRSARSCSSGWASSPPRPPPSRSSPTPRRSPSAPSRCRSRRWRRWPTSPRTTSAPWSAARRPSWPSIVPLILVGMVDGRRGIKAAWPAAVVGRPRLRHRPVRVLELPLGRAGRHRRLAARRPAPSSRCCRSGSPARRSSARPTPARARRWPAARAASTSAASRRRRRAARRRDGPDGDAQARHARARCSSPSRPT